jgi:hypothetical protein
VKTNAVKPGYGGAFDQAETAFSCKPAVREHGLHVLVPPFIGSGEVSYMRRAD